ncbi:MAG TPA: PIN domain-containing protein [Spirochaetota bacterium]|nr:PIN domain-containing protein [Spirochaetota bacterium]HPI89747.1 PIN domain-containing protein [Spirochaetota bacterium]HPR46620.1 PIN domain-containing protein [Spirochaetota bacterium]
MNGVLVDSNVILDLFLDDPRWADWSENILEKYSRQSPLYINPVIYSEISIGFERIEDLESALVKGGFKMIQFSKEALFLAGKAFLSYRKNKGLSKSTLPDFFIGAQAAVLNLKLITRDVFRYRTYFPTVKLINP